MKTVAIVQPYLAKYRLPFFCQLADRLNENGIELRVIHGTPVGEQQLRADAHTLSWALHQETMQIPKWRHRSLKIVSLGPDVRNVDLLILEQALGNAQMWFQVLRPRHFSAKKIALWGHGPILTRQASGMEQATLKYITRRADHFFAYTAAGAHFIQNPDTKVTIVNNSVDTAAISMHASENGIGSIQDRSNYLYIGGLDMSKGILKFAQVFAEAQPRGSTLYICGDGVHRSAVQAISNSSDCVSYFGPVFDAEHKARLASTCRALVQPGRAGLAIVEAFALGLPVIAARDALNAPEFDYLVDNENSLIAPSHSMMESINRLSDCDDLAIKLRAGARRSATKYNLEAMVDNFLRGIEDLVS